ncbi:MAG: hypothetical protein DRJ42_24775 [Deltaproteobacteria bacterium]|nr:MAG: hypothetical protein DRJ42_24775 [Deltaproteobacteria bacterium]
MIWVGTGILVGSLIVANSSSEHLSAPTEGRLDDVLDEGEHRDRAEAVFEEIDAFMAEQAGHHQTATEHFHSLSRSRAATVADFEDAYAELEGDAGFSRYIDLRFRLKNEFTREEWARLTSGIHAPEETVQAEPEGAAAADESEPSTDDEAE